MYPTLADSLDEKKRQRRQNRGNRGGKVARGIAAAGMIGALGSSVANPQQSSTTTQKNWGDSSLRQEGTRQSRAMRDGTRDRGNHTRGSGQNG